MDRNITLIVDAYADKPIGMFVLTAQGLLQQQRDSMVLTEGFAVTNPFETFHLQVEASLATRASHWYEERRIFCRFEWETIGELTDWLDIELCLPENTAQLYSSRPVECPAPPPDALNVELFQAHIAWKGKLLGDIKKAIEASPM